MVIEVKVVFNSGGYYVETREPSGELAMFYILIPRVTAQMNTHMWGRLSKLYSKNWHTLLLNVSCISKSQDKNKKEMVK